MVKRACVWTRVSGGGGASGSAGAGASGSSGAGASGAAPGNRGDGRAGLRIKVEPDVLAGSSLGARSAQFIKEKLLVWADITDPAWDVNALFPGSVSLASLAQAFKVLPVGSVPMRCVLVRDHAAVATATAMVAGDWCPAGSFISPEDHHADALAKEHADTETREEQWRLRQPKLNNTQGDVNGVMSQSMGDPPSSDLSSSKFKEASEERAAQLNALAAAKYRPIVVSSGATRTLSNFYQMFQPAIGAEAGTTSLVLYARWRPEAVARLSPMLQAIIGAESRSPEHTAELRWLLLEELPPGICAQTLRWLDFMTSDTGPWSLATPLTSADNWILLRSVAMRFWSDEFRADVDGSAGVPFPAGGVVYPLQHPVVREMQRSKTAVWSGLYRDPLGPSTASTVKGFFLGNAPALMRALYHTNFIAAARGYLDVRRGDPVIGGACYPGSDRSHWQTFRQPLGLLIAGGAVLNALLIRRRITLQDIDLWLVGATDAAAAEAIIELFLRELAKEYAILEATLTERALTLLLDHHVVGGMRRTDSGLLVQVSARSFASAFEVVNSFDLDSSMALVDGLGTVYASERFLTAFSRGNVNVLLPVDVSPNGRSGPRIDKALASGFRTVCPPEDDWGSAPAGQAGRSSGSGSSVVLKSRGAVAIRDLTRLLGMMQSWWWPVSTQAWRAGGVPMSLVLNLLKAVASDEARMEWQLRMTCASPRRSLVPPTSP